MSEFLNFFDEALLLLIYDKFIFHLIFVVFYCKLLDIIQ